MTQQQTGDWLNAGAVDDILHGAHSLEGLGLHALAGVLLQLHHQILRCLFRDRNNIGYQLRTRRTFIDNNRHIGNT